MADEKSKAPPAGTIPPPPVKKGGGGGSVVGTIVGVVLTAVLSGGAAFGGAKFGAAQAGGKHEEAEHERAPGIPTVRAPGVTVPLDPFLVGINDAAGKQRAVKLTLVLELRPLEKAEEMKAFVPRLRDSTLSYLRGLTFEEASSAQHVEKMRGELLERYAKLGAIAIDQVLITDFVAQ